MDGASDSISIVMFLVQTVPNDVIRLRVPR